VKHSESQNCFSNGTPLFWHPISPSSSEDGKKGECLTVGIVNVVQLKGGSSAVGL
jgi:hypothetical protein